MFNNKKELIMAIDEMIIRKKDYITLISLMKNTSSALFTKIIEEIINGKIYISDFEPIFKEEVDDYMLENIEIQRKIETTLKNAISLRESYDNELLNKYEQTQKIFVDLDNQKKYDEKLKMLASIIDKTSDDIPQELAIKLFTVFSDSKKIDSFLFDDNTFRFPLEQENIILDKYDIDFMSNHDISEDTMKKYKILTYLFNSESE